MEKAKRARAGSKAGRMLRAEYRTRYNYGGDLKNTVLSHVSLFVFLHFSEAPRIRIKNMIEYARLLQS